MFHENSNSIQRIAPFSRKVWLASPTMHGPELEYVRKAYETNWMSTVGENINEIEKMASEMVGVKYAVALSCGTAALHMAMKLAGVKPGDKVFASDMTFDATVNPVVYEGGEPAFRRGFFLAQGLTDESGSMIFGTVTENVGQQMENTEDIQVILADRQEVLRILREERVSMRCGLMLMQFLKTEPEAPFAFLYL